MSLVEIVNDGDVKTETVTTGPVISVKSACLMCKKDCTKKGLLISLLLVATLITFPTLAVIYHNEIYVGLFPMVIFFENNPVSGAFIIMGVCMIWIPLFMPIPVISIGCGFIYNSVLKSQVKGFFVGFLVAWCG